MPHNKDTLYANPLATVPDFVFDQAVVDVFADMIDRSVPGYKTLLQGTEAIAAQYGQTDSSLYDLGCSLGASTAALYRGMQGRDCQLIAVDNAWPMVQRCQTLLATAGVQPVQCVCADIEAINILDASVVVLNFTLQFIACERRQAVLQTIYDGLRTGGVLLLSEKIRADEPQQQAFTTTMHHAFKRLQGYSELEISQKRTALEQVLLPETLDQHRQRLYDVGFKAVHVWFECMGFVSLVALK